MLEIVLLILKIIGIILAVILGILIVVLSLLLFVPVRYRGKVSVADAEEGENAGTDVDGKKISVCFSAAWLLKIVRVLLSYEKTVRLRVKILFFTVLDTAKAAELSEGGKKQAKDRKSSGKKDKEEDRIVPEQSGQELGKGMSADTDRSPEQVTEETESADARKAESRPWQKISDILYTIRNFCDKLKEMKEKRSHIWEFWNADHVVASRSILWKELSYLLRHSKPRKLKGHLAFGFGDPATTGYAMAAYGILCPIWNPDILVEPDFEREKLQCDITIKGIIRACHFVKIIAGLLLSKDVRHTIKDIRSGEIL